jgi:hypothetical protein
MKTLGAILFGIIFFCKVQCADKTRILTDTLIGANHPFIQYTGRIDWSNPAQPAFWTPGSYAKFKFLGPSCEILLNDQGHNYMEVVIDDTIFYRVKTQGVPFGYNIRLDSREEEEHTLLLCKNTESNLGPVEFQGVRCKKVVPLPEKKLRKLEFIGNSITCGTGSDLSSIPCGSGEWADQHNAYMSYGPLVARRLKAQWHLSSYSGIGLIKSCCGIGFTMPDVFDKLNLKPSAPAWDFSRYIPDAVTICLGQNDGIQDSATFCSAYVRFIEKIRGYYPKAHIVCLTSPMADNELTQALKKYLTAIVGYVNKQGDVKVHTFFFSRSYNSGCDRHPDLKEHVLIANELEPYLRKLLGW